MIAELGLAALWLAAALSLLQLGLGVASLILPAGGAGGDGDHAQHGGGVTDEALPITPPPPSGWSPSPSAMGRINPYAAAIRPIAVVQALLVGLSFLALVQLFLRTDLSVAL